MHQPLDEKISNMFKLAIADLKILFNKNPIKITSSIDDLGDVVLSIGDQTATITKSMLNQQDSDGNTIFHLTLLICERPSNAGRRWYFPDNPAQEQLFKQLLSLGVTPEIVNRQNNKGETALMFSAMLNNIEMAKLLLAQGADANIKSQSGYTPLTMSVASQYPADMAILLLDNKANPNIPDPDGKTTLDLAKENNNEALIKVLEKPTETHASKTGTEIKSPDLTAPEEKQSDNKSTQKDSVEKNKINIDEILVDGQYCSLHRAVDSNNVEEVRTLLDKKNPALINHKGPAKLTPLDYFLYNPKKHSDPDVEILKLLLEAGAEVNLQNGNGSWPLTIAADTGRTEQVKLLLTKNPDVNVLNNHGDTALILAARRGNTEMAKLLLTQNAQVNIQDEIGRSALHFAAAQSNIELAKLLIEKGADITLETRDHRTPLSVFETNKNNFHREKNEEFIKLLTPKLEEKQQLGESQGSVSAQSDEKPTSKESKTKPKPKEKSVSDSVEDTKKRSFADILAKSSADIIKGMKWAALPKISVSNIDKFKEVDSLVKNLNFGELADNLETKRALFNLAVYSSMLPGDTKTAGGYKKTGLIFLLNQLSESPDKASALIEKALVDPSLIKNRGSGLYFFHSLRHQVYNDAKKNIFGKHTLARSTTEELLIDLKNSLKPGKADEDVVDNSRDESAGHSR